MKDNGTKLTSNINLFTLFASVFLAVLLSCGGGGEDPNNDALKRVNACNKITPEFNQGIYGCITTTNDVGYPSTDIVSDFTIYLYSDSITAPTSEEDPPLAETKSNQSGYYELPVAPGEYWLCTSFFRCTLITISPEEKLRKNYDFGPGSGW